MSRHILEPAAQDLADATAKPPFLYELAPDRARKVLDDIQAASISKLDVDLGPLGRTAAAEQTRAEAAAELDRWNVDPDAPHVLAVRAYTESYRHGADVLARLDGISPERQDGRIMREYISGLPDHLAQAVLAVTEKQTPAPPTDSTVIRMAVTQLLSDAGHAAPVFVTAYDVHSFDRQSRHPLRSAARELVGKPVTVLLAARVPASADPQPSVTMQLDPKSASAASGLLDGAGHTEALRPAVGHPAEGKRLVASYRAVTRPPAW